MTAPRRGERPPARPTRNGDAGKGTGFVSGRQTTRLIPPFALPYSAPRMAAGEARQL